MPNIKNVEKIPAALGNISLSGAFIAIALSVMSYYIGVLSTELKFSKQGGIQPSQVANNATAPKEPEAPANIEKPNDQDHRRGGGNPKIALIEYSDFDCPYCASFHPTVQQAIKEYPELVWIYRHLPLSIHPNALPKALASECVFKLSNDETFWKFTDLLFERKSSVDELAGIVSAEYGISEQAFTTCLNNEETSGRVKADMDSASEAGVRGTPGSFVMNLESGEIVSIPGAQPYDAVKKAIESLL